MGELDKLEFVKPADIERRSFEIISRELGDKHLDARNELVVKRVIHTTADFDYADNLVFSENATAIGVQALRAGCSIVTDTQMAASGINKRVLARFGGQVHNFMQDADVAAEARERGVTRSAVCMERAAALKKPLIYVIGHAPPALVRLYEMLQEGEMPFPPQLIVGVPVGFVNVVESKELICGLDVPHIVARGRKGGSNVAAAICNALLYLASGDARE